MNSNKPSLANHNNAIKYVESVTGVKGKIYYANWNRIAVKLPKRGVHFSTVVANLRRAFGKMKTDVTRKGGFWSKDVKHGRVVLQSDPSGTMYVHVYNHKFDRSAPASADMPKVHKPKH